MKQKYWDWIGEMFLCLILTMPYLFFVNMGIVLVNAIFLDSYLNTWLIFGSGSIGIGLMMVIYRLITKKHFIEKFYDEGMISHKRQ